MTLPPGFRFHPTDEELVVYYLKNRVINELEEKVITDVDLYKCEPWDLPDKAAHLGSNIEWFFFSPRDRKYPNGQRTNRATEKGYWKATGRDRNVKSSGKVVGMKKTLVFYKGRAPQGERTDWLMHEYRLEGDDVENIHRSQEAFVLCRVFKKTPFRPDVHPTGSPSADDEIDRTDPDPTDENSSLFPEHEMKPSLELLPLKSVHGSTVQQGEVKMAATGQGEVQGEVSIEDIWGMTGYSSDGTGLGEVNLTKEDFWEEMGIMGPMDPYPGLGPNGSNSAQPIMDLTNVGSRSDSMNTASGNAYTWPMYHSFSLGEIGGLDVLPPLLEDSLPPLQEQSPSPPTSLDFMNSFSEMVNSSFGGSVKNYGVSPTPQNTQNMQNTFGIQVRPRLPQAAAAADFTTPWKATRLIRLQKRPAPPPPHMEIKNNEQSENEKSDRTRNTPAAASEKKEAEALHADRTHDVSYDEGSVPSMAVTETREAAAADLPDQPGLLTTENISRELSQSSSSEPLLSTTVDGKQAQIDCALVSSELHSRSPCAEGSAVSETSLPGHLVDEISENCVSDSVILLNSVTPDLLPPLNTTGVVESVPQDPSGSIGRKFSESVVPLSIGGIVEFVPQHPPDSIGKKCSDSEIPEETVAPNNIIGQLPLPAVNGLVKLLDSVHLAAAAEYPSSNSKQVKLKRSALELLPPGTIGSIHVNAVTISCTCNKVDNQPHVQSTRCDCYRDSQGVYNVLPGSPWEKIAPHPKNVQQQEQQTVVTPVPEAGGNRLLRRARGVVGVFFMGVLSAFCGMILVKRLILSGVHTYLGKCQQSP